MEWTDYDVFRANGTASDMYGPDWQVKPLVVVTSTGLTFNEQAGRTFGLRAEVPVRICFAGDATIGFRVLGKHENQVGAAVIRANGKRKKDPSPSSVICSGPLAKRLEQYRGNVCELTMEAGSHVIAALLDEPNFRFQPRKNPRVKQ
jgi:hypothetical protein